MEPVGERGHDRRRSGQSELRRAAAARLVERHGSAIMRVARRYSRNAHDADDAYQRAVEILLTKAPDVPEAELVPWLKTVVKHEAFAIRRSRDRLGLAADDGFDGETSEAAAAAPDEQAEHLDRLRVGAEALQRLKPQEVRCLLLKAEGYSYRQICEETGWTYTKVNRCLTEGRQNFRAKVAGIESGDECERLAPLLSRLADGEATPEDMATLRPHLRACLPCRAALRDFRAAPARVAAFVPPVALGFGALGDRLLRWIERMRAKVVDGGGPSASGGSVQGAAGAAAPKAAVALAAVVIAGGAAFVTVDGSKSPEGSSAGVMAEGGTTPHPAGRGTERALGRRTPATRPPRSKSKRRTPSRRAKRTSASRKLAPAASLTRAAAAAPSSAPSAAAAPTPAPDPAPAPSAPTPATAPPPSNPAAGTSDGGEFVLGN